MDIYNQCHSASYLKPFFNDFVVSYLDKYYIEGVQTANPQNEVEERALTFFVKTISSVKSINNLFLLGDIVSARILIRSLFELIVLMKKINKDKEEFVRFSKAYGKFKSIDASKIQLEEIKNKGEYFEAFYTEAELTANLVNLKREIEELGFLSTWNKTEGRPKVEGYFEIKQMAIDVDMENLYSTTYKNLCFDTHTSSNHFYKYIFQDVSGNKLLNLHPYLHELDLMIYTTCSVLIGFFECSEDLLRIDRKCTANMQFQKLIEISFILKDKLLEQGHLKKNGIIAPIR
ncbi:DUF5677 domain-containing protein [Viridibacillus sp. FSL R5-0477]|uniref:Uncharacterized protein n=1 Tax=Viridibacillus arenosi FSL R5-213 TaxID=1227360 RepID=W4EUG7_9BACL|nr:DUF5677 domain-containing protein [Viridibacillus arenosi]ETT84190.1 hypothetical protein C176_12518 [Viridibacillus arenosi FSL R5-213]OMC90016.1 hypothetical protein BK137_14810 [Viridibacillus arenosi]